MAKRYHSEEHVHKEWVVDVFVCPDCGFCFDATHTQNDEEGGWVCPACAEKELDVALDRLDRIRDQLKIAEEGVDIELSLYMHLMDILEDNGPIDRPYDRGKMTPEQIEHEKEETEVKARRLNREQWDMWEQEVKEQVGRV